MLHVGLCADAIFPSLFLVWPISILLLIPVIWVEAIYSRSCLPLAKWESIRVLGVANLLSLIAGLPIANLAAFGFQYLLESAYFRSNGRVQAQAAQVHLVDPSRLRLHDTGTLMWLGLYPRWIMFAAGITMMVICFFVSWWVEGKWLSRYMRKREPSKLSECSTVARNANVLSYAFLTVIVLLIFVLLWPMDINSILSTLLQT
jgi:hypothetical protein